MFDVRFWLILFLSYVMVCNLVDSCMKKRGRCGCSCVRYLDENLGHQRDQAIFSSLAVPGIEVFCPSNIVNIIESCELFGVSSSSYFSHCQHGQSRPTPKISLSLLPPTDRKLRHIRPGCPLPPATAWSEKEQDAGRVECPASDGHPRLRSQRYRLQSLLPGC